MIWVSLIIAVIELIMKLPELIDLFHRIFGRIGTHSILRQHSLMLRMYELVAEARQAPEGMASEDLKKPFEDFLSEIS